VPYQFLTIEAKWQQYWHEHRTFRTDGSTSRPKLYVLDMYPYPSGAGLHVGHPKDIPPPTSSAAIEE